MNPSRRNQVLLLVEYVVFAVALAFLGPTTVLPAFIRLLGGSPLVVGLLGAIQSGGWLLPQMFAGRYASNRQEIKGLVVMPVVVSRGALVALVPLLWLFALQAPALALASILVAWAIFNIADGFASVPWLDLVAKAVTLEERGRALGMAQSAASLLGIGVGAAVAAILARKAVFPANHVLLVAIAAFTFALSVPLLAAIHEPKGVVQGEARLPWREYFPYMVRILRHDAPFAWLTWLRWLGGVADMASAFYVLYATGRLHLPEQAIGLFISAGVVGGLVSGIVLGPLGDRRGRRSIITLIMGLRCLSPLLALAAPLLARLYPSLTLAAFALLFAVMGFANGGQLVGVMNYLLEIAPASERSAYIGLYNTLGGLLLVAPLVAGWLVEVASYELLFAVCFIAAAAGLALALHGPQPLPAQRASQAV